MPRHYLCDLENVHDRWSSLLDGAGAGDRFTLFYSENVTNVSLGMFGKACARGVRFDFAECECGRPNALDFQLVTELGRLSAMEPDTEYVIVSADQGFQSVVGFLSDRGVSVSCHAPAVAREPEPARERGVRDEYLERLLSAGLERKDADALAGVFVETMAAPQNRRKLDCRNRIRAMYGAQDGEEIYIRVKAIVHDVAVNGPFPTVAKAAKKSKPSLNMENLSGALSSANVHVDEANLGRVLDAVVKARKTKNPGQSLGDKLAKVLGTKHGNMALPVVRKFL